MKKLISILLITVLLLTGCSAANDGQGGLTSFSASDLEGNTQTETLFEGKKLTVLNIWATYCGPCIQEMPALAEIHEEYAAKGVQIVGIVSDVPSVDSTTADTARTLIKDANVNYVNLLPSQDMQSILQNVAYVPTTIFLNEKGEQVGDLQIGSRSKAAWEDLINDMLEEVK